MNNLIWDCGGLQLEALLLNSNSKIEFQVVPGHKSLSAASVWSKTTLITGGVGGASVDPPSRGWYIKFATDTIFIKKNWF